MENNKWLKELGLSWYDLPGNYISKTSLKVRLRHRWYKIRRGFCFMFSSLEDHAPAYDDKYESPAFDIRNKAGKDGMCEYEFFSLDYSMALYIYPRLCEFRENYATTGTPSCFCFDEEGNELKDDENYDSNAEWLKVLDKMILAFKYIIKQPDWNDGQELSDIDKTIEEGLELFARYYRSLWW